MDYNNIESQVMDYVMKKTYLGLALEETLEELGLEHMSRDFGQAFKDAFLKNYNQLLNDSKPVKIAGIEQSLKESPIGLGNQHSCYTLIANKINYRGQIEFLNRKSNSSTCIEAFSDNSKKKISKAPKLLKKPQKLLSTGLRTADETKRTKRGRIEEEDSQYES